MAPRGPETPPPSHGHVHARAHARTVTFKYNCVTVRRPRVYIKLSMAMSIVLDSGVSLGCSPPPRKGARGRVHRPPSVPSSHGHAQVPDLTFDCNIRARRRRRRRLSGGGSQTDWSSSRTGLVCPSPARMAARQPSDPTDLSGALLASARWMAGSQRRQQHEQLIADIPRRGGALVGMMAETAAEPSAAVHGDAGRVRGRF